MSALIQAMQETADSLDGLVFGNAPSAYREWKYRFWAAPPDSGILAEDANDGSLRAALLQIDQAFANLFN